MFNRHTSSWETPHLKDDKWKRKKSMPMAKSKIEPAAKPLEADNRKNRNFPKHTLEAALPLAQKIQDEMGGKAMNRLLLADALGSTPSSSNFRQLLSSAYKYGLTDGTEKADNISLTAVGSAATQQTDASARVRALRTAALTPAFFGQVLRDYANKKLPSPEMLPKILKQQYGVPADLVDECASHLAANGKFVDIVREIGGSPHVLLDAELSTVHPAPLEGTEDSTDESSFTAPSAQPITVQPSSPPVMPKPSFGAGPKPIFVGHGKNKGPLQQLQGLLTTFQIPHKIVVDEPNLGRPISQKVKRRLRSVVQPFSYLLGMKSCSMRRAMKSGGRVRM